MHPVLREAEQAFRHMLQEAGANAGPLTSIEPLQDTFTGNWTVTMQARGIPRFAFTIGAQRLEEYRDHRYILDGHFEAEARALYHPMLLRHLAELRLAPIRAQFDAMRATMIDRVPVISAELFEDAMAGARRGYPSATEFTLAVDWAGERGTEAVMPRANEMALSLFTPNEPNVWSAELNRLLYADGHDAFITSMVVGGGRNGGPQWEQRAAAEERGRKLLLEWLSPEERAEYEQSGQFHVTGQSGTRYRIRSGHSFNVDALDKKGAVEDVIYFLPQGGLVLGDQLLAQKIALETDEAGALKIANHDRRQNGAPAFVEYFDQRLCYVNNTGILAAGGGGGT